MKTRYDFKAIRAKAKEIGWGYRIKNYESGNLFGLRYWIQAPKSGDISCSHAQKDMLSCHYNATMELRQIMIDNNWCTETDYII